MYKKLLAVAGASCLLFTGCIDDNYDLSNIDTTSEIKVDNLTLPVNIDTMKLDQVFKLEDTSNIKIIEDNGQRIYALCQKDSFNSQSIEVQTIHIAAPPINPTHVGLTLPFNSKRRRIQSPDIPIPAAATSFSYETGDVDPAIFGLQAIYTYNTSLDITITVDGVDISAVDLKNIHFQLPIGMKVSNLSAGSYNPEDGIWTIRDIKSANGRDITAHLDIDMMDLSTANPKLTFDTNRHYMRIDGSLGLADGTAVLDLDALAGAHPHSMAVDIKYELSDINVTGVSGKLDYAIEGINIDPVSIGTLPDFLKGEGTNIRIANPQLCLSLNNPVGDQNITYETGLRLTALRDNGVPAQSFSPDNNALVKVLCDHGVKGPYNFLISPKETTPPAEFSENLSWVPFSSFSDILAVPEAYADKATLPERIAIDVVNPCLTPGQSVDNFPLGRKLEPVKGTYELIAPLGFKEGSILIMETTEDGWSSDDLKKMTISTLTITATVDNSAPVSAELDGYPIDSTGQQIGNVTVTSNTVAANTDGQQLTITMSGEIKDLDGINIRAIMRSSDNSSPLAPNQYLLFKNVRATVSGSYITDF